MPCRDGGPSEDDEEEDEFLAAILCSIFTAWEKDGRKVRQELKNLELDAVESGVDLPDILQWWNEHKREDERRRRREKERRAQYLKLKEEFENEA